MLARDVGASARLEAGHQLHRVQLRAAAVDGLPATCYRDHGVTLQFGGSDQWGNLTGGRRARSAAPTAASAHAFATPLVTKADGTKYGKTEGGALWLDPEMMSPYAFYQFWLNVEDEKVGELLRIFTFLSPRGDRGARGSRHAEKPFLRAGPEGAGRRR